MKPVAPARDLPMASSSSMKMMQGALSLACSKRSRTRAAPTPTNISTNSEPDSVKNGTSASPATARASSVLPVPGGPDQQHALGDAAAEALVLLGVLQEVDDLDELGLGLVDAGHVVEGGLQLLAVVDLVLAAAERQRLGGAAADPAHQEHPDGDHDAERDDPAEEQILPERRLDPAGELDLVRLQLGHERLLVHARDAGDREDAHLLLGAEPSGAGGRPAALGGAGSAPGLAMPRISRSVRATRSIWSARSSSRNFDIGISTRARGQQPGLQQRQQQHHDEHVGERELDALGEPRLHRGSLCVMLASGVGCVKLAAALSA